MFKKSWFLVLSVLVVAMLLTSAGCTTSSTPSASPAPTQAQAAPTSAPTVAPVPTQASVAAPTSGATGSSKLDAFKANADQLFTNWTLSQTGKPPATGPKAVSGKKVIYIPLTMAINTLSAASKEQETAAKILGWDYSVIDPAGDPNKMADALDKAIAMKVNGIVMDAIDAKTVLEPLRRVKAAGIPIGGLGNSDVPEKLFTFSVSPTGVYALQGQMSAVAAYKLTGYNVKAIMFTLAESQAAVDRERAFEAYAKECTDAGGQFQIIAKQPFITAEMSTKLPTLASAQVRSNPSCNLIWAADDATAQFIVDGLQSAGIADTSKVMVEGFNGGLPNLELIRKGGLQKSTIAVAIAQVAWAKMDELNRIFAGEKPIGGDTRGYPMKLIIKDNCPPVGAWTGDFDQQTLYKSIWVGQ